MKMVMIVTVLLCALAGCSKRALVTAQVCLQHDRGAAEFKQLMNSIAQSRQMKLYDSSAALGAALERAHGPTLTMDIRLEGADEVGLLAGNPGLPNNQVVVGFFEGRNPIEGQRFADAVVSEMRSHWYVEIVPRGKGAFPLTNCPTGG